MPVKMCGAVVNMRAYTCCCEREPGHDGWHIDGVHAWPPGCDDGPKPGNIQIVRLGADPHMRTNDDGTPIRTVYYRDLSISRSETFYCWLSHWSKDWPQPPNHPSGALAQT